MDASPQRSTLRPPSRPDILWALAAGIVALALYIRTLAPGMTADVDSAMFQFIGRVLGVAHNPGYPVYSLLTHVFSYVPIGPLAYRINLFSAVLGALAVAAAFLIGRRLECRTVVALAAALGLACGPVYWSQAIIAEVYTLNAALVAGMLLALLVWMDTGRPGFFYSSVALLGIGLGNHTTIVGFAPGMAAAALLTDRAFVLRLRTLATTAAILLAGLIPYGFIILRSNQPGAYVESRATTIPELGRVIFANQFQDRLFAFDWRTLVHQRIPSFVSDILSPELTPAGLLLAALGVLWLLRRRLPQALMLLVGAGAVLVFALNYSVVDTPVFLIPFMLVLWICAGVGAEQVARAIGARSRGLGNAFAFLGLLLPVWLCVHNLPSTDRSRDYEAQVQIDRLFDALPDRATIVSEDFLADRMVNFKLLGDPLTRGRRIEIGSRAAADVRRKLDEGSKVFAFQKAAARLRHDALDVSFGAVSAMDGPLDEFLSRLADGAVVTLAVPARISAEFAASSGVQLSAIGGPPSLDAIAPSNAVFAGVRGAGAAAIEQHSRFDVHLEAGTGGQLGGVPIALSLPVELRAGPFEAAIRQGSRDLVRTTEGVAMAVWTPDGQLADTYVLQPGDGFRVPLPTNPLSVYALRGVRPNQQVTTARWTDLAPSAATGSLELRVPSGRTAVLYVSDDARLAPRAIDKLADPVSVEVASFEPRERAALEAQLAADDVVDAGLVTGLVADGHVSRVVVRAPGRTSGSVTIALGGVPSRAVARLIGTPGAASAFSVNTDGLLRRPDRVSEVLLMGRDEQAQLTGDGWSEVDWDDVGPYRWMTATEARLVLPVVGTHASRIRIQAYRREASGATAVRLRVNGTELSSQPLTAGWNAYEWAVPTGLLMAGTNEASVLVDGLSAAPGQAPRGIAVTELRVIQAQP